MDIVIASLYSNDQSVVMGVMHLARIRLTKSNVVILPSECLGGWTIKVKKIRYGGASRASLAYRCWDCLDSPSMCGPLKIVVISLAGFVTYSDRFPRLSFLLPWLFQRSMNSPRWPLQIRSSVSSFKCLQFVDSCPVCWWKRQYFFGSRCSACIGMGSLNSCESEIAKIWSLEALKDV